MIFLGHSTKGVVFFKIVYIVSIFPIVFECLFIIISSTDCLIGLCGEHRLTGSELNRYLKATELHTYDIIIFRGGFTNVYEKAAVCVIWVEHGGSRFLRNAGNRPQNYILSQSWKPVLISIKIHFYVWHSVVCLKYEHVKSITFTSQHLHN